MIFLPVVFMRTISGMLFKELALVVVFALMCSLLVALTLVPMLASRYLHLGRGETVGRGGPARRASEPGSAASRTATPAAWRPCCATARSSSW